MVTNITLCMTPDTTTNYEKYYWMSIVDKKDNNTVTARTCVVDVKKGTSDGDWICCQSLISPSQFSMSYDIVIADPFIVGGTNANALCGPDGNILCPNWNTTSNPSSNNEVGFAKIKVEDGGNNNKVLAGTIDHFVANKDTCGMESKGSLCWGTQEFQHVHIGPGKCLVGGVTMETQACSAYGWKCLDKDC